ncbi:MAG: hypothetical protein OSA98_15940 [Rubripirellula sp.]|nr:hypothetical protein [Rubripirellula sp.]
MFFHLNWMFVLLVYFASPALGDGKVSFSAQVAPLLQSQCVACHGDDVAEADYRLDTYERLMLLADGSPAVIREQAGDSKLFQVLVHEDEDLRMPSESDSLPVASINLMRRWITEGAGFDGESKDQSLSELLPLKTHPQAPEIYPARIPLSAMAFNPAGDQLLISGYHEITVWNLEGELLQRIGDQGERTYSIDLHPTLPLVLSASGRPGVSGELRLFDLSTGSLKSVLVATDEVIMDARFSPDGKTIAVAMPDGSTQLISTETGSVTGRLLGHSDQVTSLAWHADGIRLATTSRDHTAKVFDCQSGASVATFTGHTKAVNDIVFLNNDQALSVSNDGTAQLWNVRDGKRIREVLRGKTPVLTLALAPDKYAVGGSMATQWFKRDGNQPIKRFDEPKHWTTISVFDAPGSTFVIGTQAGDVVIRKNETSVTQFEAIPGN